MKLLIPVLLTILCIAEAKTAEPQRIYLNHNGITQDTTITVPALPPAIASCLEIRMDIPGKGFGKKNSNKIILSWQDKDNKVWSAAFSTFSSGSDELLDGGRLSVSVTNTASKKPVFENTFNDIVTDMNTELSICINFTDTEAVLLAGHNKLKEISVLSGEFNPSGAIDFKIEGRIEIYSIVSEYSEDLRTILQTGLCEEDILKMITGRQQPAGIWKALDRDTDSKYALAGGRYTLAIVPVQDTNEFDILYLSGAEVNTSTWKTGMKKGKLIPTAFKNHYDLIWYDSALEPIEYDATASVDQEIILSLSFPLLKSTLRFVRQ